MRGFSSLLIGLGLTAGMAVLSPTTASACPRGLQCLVTTSHQVTAEVARPRPTMLRLAIAQPSHRATAAAVDLRLSNRLDQALLAKPTPKPNTLAMPPIWQQLRTGLYDRMPHYEERQFTLTMSPVVVSGTFDTVPGVGVAGDF